MGKFSEILKRKRKHYGDTDFAINAAAEEYAIHCAKVNINTVKESEEHFDLYSQWEEEAFLDGAKQMRDQILERIGNE
jgi:hypothetical protein